MATFVKFQDFVEALGLGEHDLNTDTFRVYLTNNTPSVSADADKADLVGITVQNGYTEADIQNTWSEAAGTGTMAAVDVVFTASGGNFGPFRYAVIFNDTHADDGLMSYFDYGSAITVLVGETFTVDFGASLCTIA